MQINKSTKVSVVIKHNIEAIDAIASINHHFEKLRNPILRRLLAPRVTLEEAAKIGKCEVDVLLNKLEKLGFEVTYKSTTEKSSPSITSIPQNIVVKKTIDIQPMLDENIDPFNLIMDSLKNYSTGETLLIISPFEPIPLIRILEKKGHIISIIEQNGVYETYITIQDVQPENPDSDKLSHELSTLEFENLLTSFAQNRIEIDVRDLEMPLPMITILENLESLPNGTVLYVHHKKVPEHLLEELDTRNYHYHYQIIDSTFVELLIYQ